VQGESSVLVPPLNAQQLKHIQKCFKNVDRKLNGHNHWEEDNLINLEDVVEKHVNIGVLMRDLNEHLTRNALHELLLVTYLPMSSILNAFV